MSDGQTIVADLEELAGRLDTASRELYKVQQDFDATTERYAKATA